MPAFKKPSSSGSSAGQGMHAASSGAAQRPETAIKRMDEPRSQQELDAIAAAHINAIKERAQKADDNTSAMLAAEADPETSASDLSGNWKLAP